MKIIDYFNKIISDQLAYKNKDVRLSGVSTGGRRGGCTIFGKKFYLILGSEYKTRNYGYAVKKLGPVSYVGRFFFLVFFFLLDFIIWLADNPPKVLVDLVNWLGSIGEEIGNKIAPAIPDITTSPSFDLVFTVVFFTGCLLFMYFAMFRGLARWHGQEHRAIAAAEAKDIENMEKYSVVNDRCGGTFILSIYAYLFIAIYFVVFVFHLPGYGVYTMTALMMYAEAKYFHHYNVLGIAFGRFIQKKFTTREPWPWQNQIGKEGITELMKAERGEPFREKHVMFTRKLECLPDV